MSQGNNQNQNSNYDPRSNKPLFDNANVDNIANQSFNNIVAAGNYSPPEQTRLLSGDSSAPFNQQYLSQYFKDTKGLTNQSALDNIGSTTRRPEYLSEQLRGINELLNTNNPDYNFYRPGAAEISRQSAGYGGDREDRQRSRASSFKRYGFNQNPSLNSSAYNEGSLSSRGVSPNQGFRGIESGLSSLYFNPPSDINNDFVAQGTGDARYGGQDLSYLGQGTFNQNANGNNASENFADRVGRVGAAGGYIYDSTGYNSVNANYDRSKPYSYQNTVGGTIQSGPGQSEFYSSTSGYITPSLQTPDPNSFNYNQSINSSIAGAAQVGSQNQLIGGADGSGNTQTQRNELNPIQLATDPLGALLASQGTIITKDSAQAGSAANNAALSGGSLSAPGSVQLGQGNIQSSQTDAVSPIFGNEVTAGTATGQNSQQNLNVGSQGGQASAGSAIQQAATANEGIDQTRVQVLPGIIPIGGSDNTYQFVDSSSNTAQQAKNEAQASSSTPTTIPSGSSLSSLADLLGQGAQASSTQQGVTSANTGYTNANTATDLTGNVGAAGAGTTANQNQASAGSASAESQTLQNNVTPNSGGLPGAIISGVAGSVPLVGGALSSLAGLLFGTTKVEQDNANSSANAAVANQGNIDINNPGAAQANTSGQAQSQASSTSPIFANQSNTAAGVDVNGNVAGIVNSPGGSASAGTNANILSNADSSIDQTRTTTNGLMQGFGKKSVDEVDQGLNTGITGTAGSNINISGDAQAQANQNVNANASAQNIINGANDTGLNSDLNLNSQLNTSGQTTGNNTSLVGTANLASDIGQQGSQNNTALTNTANLIGTLQGSNASIDGVSTAQSILSGTQGADIKAQAEIQAEKFITDLSQALPQDAQSAAIIARLQADPSLAWLFDGKNSPKSVLEALASGTSTSNGGYVAPSANFYGDGNELVTTAANLESGIKIDPNSTAGIQRYYSDPQSGRTFANVQGEVREVKEGQFVPIDYRDEFTLKALANSDTTGASADLQAQGRVKGQQYLFQGSSGDPVYDAMAREAIARLDNSYQQGQADPYAEQIAQLLGLTSGQQFNGKDYSYYEPVANALRQQRDFDTQRGYTLGGSALDFDNITAKAKAQSTAQMLGYGSNLNTDVATTDWTKDGVLRNTFNGTDYNPYNTGTTQGNTDLYKSMDFNINGQDATSQMLGNLINQDQYGPVDLSLKASGAKSVFTPIKYNNDSNAGRLESNRWKAADSARGAINSGQLGETGLTQYDNPLTQEEYRSNLGNLLGATPAKYYEASAEAKKSGFADMTEAKYKTLTGIQKQIADSAYLLKDNPEYLKYASDYDKYFTNGGVPSLPPQYFTQTKAQQDAADQAYYLQNLNNLISGQDKTR